MRRDIFNKNEKITALQAALHELGTTHEAQLRSQRNEGKDRLAEERATALDTQEQLRAEVDSLTKELSELEKFTAEKDELEKSRLRMRAETDELKTKLEETEAAGERQYIQGTMTLKKGYEQKFEEMKKRCGFSCMCLRRIDSCGGPMWRPRVLRRSPNLSAATRRRLCCEH